MHNSFVLYAMESDNIRKQTEGIRAMMLACFSTFDALEMASISQFQLHEGQMALLWVSKLYSPKTAFSRCLGSSSSWPDVFALPPLHTWPKPGMVQGQGNKPQAVWLLSTEKII